MWFIGTLAVLHSTMRDSQVVAAIVAGDPEGLAEAYDRYASPLYTYCRSLLREPADAADAVQDTFVIAASRLAGLRDPNRLRPWLYAVARNECHRRLRARAAQIATPLDDMPDVTDTSADVTGEAERDDLRRLLRSAVRGLNTGEQDLIELQLQQGLEVAEIADVLGVSRNHAHALLSRARDQLEISLGALLVARSGRKDCAALNTMLGDWDGQLNVLMRKRINRHVENCPTCTERKKRELAPALLLGLAPLAALPTAAVPPGLREQVLRLASSDTPDAAAHRASVAQRTGPFGQHGFPKPLDPPKSTWWRSRSGQAVAAVAVAAVVAAVTLVAVALAASGPGHHGGSAAALGLGSGPGTSAAAAAGTAGGAPSGPSSQPQPTVSAKGAAHVAPTPAPGGTAPSGAGGAGGGTGAATAPATGATPTSPSSPGHSGHPSPKASAPSSKSSTKPAPSKSSAKPTPSKSSSKPTSTPTATASSSPSRGILTVTPTTIVLGVNGGSLTLRASYGTVDWSIAESSGLVGHVTVSPAAGTLASGQSTTVTLSVSGLLSGLRVAAPADGVGACVDCTLTVNPGDITVTVVLDISVGGSSSAAQSSPPQSSPPGDDATAGRLEN
jgi:RNA polymerase sigma factor (sigma-70 family)